jgi:hypothetical protein
MGGHGSGALPLGWPALSSRHGASHRDCGFAEHGRRRCAQPAGRG